MRRNLTKVLSLLLMLAVFCSVIVATSVTSHAASTYLTVKGVTIRDGEYLRENDNTTTTRPGSGSDYAYYKDGVLYLYNFDINFNDSAMFSAIYTAREKLVIELNGSNTITATQKYAIRTKTDTVLIFRGSGSLTLNSSADYGIICGERIEITGGTLNINAVGKAIDVDNYVQTGGTVNVTSSKDYEALYIPENATISGGTLTVKASNASCAANIGGNMTVGGGTVNINPQTDMAGMAVGGTYSQTGGKVNLATKGYAGIVVTGTNKVSLTGGELNATGNGIGLQTSRANVEIGRCDVTMEGVSTGIDCAGTVTVNGNGITKITAKTNGISCKDFYITNTCEFLVSGQSGLAVKSTDKCWVVSTSYATSVSTNYQGKDAVPLTNQSANTAKYFYTREVDVYIAGVPIGIGEYLPQNGKAASTYKLSDNYINIQMNGERTELIFHNCNVAATGTTEAIKANTAIQISGSGTLSITAQSGSAILVSSGYLVIEHSGTVNIKSNTMNGIVLQNGQYIHNSGTVNIESSNGILAVKGDVTIDKGTLNIKSSGIGITCKNVEINGGNLDVTATSSLQAMLLTGRITYKTGLVALGVPITSTSGNLESLNTAQINNYKRVYVGEHVCSGGTATCQTLAKCSTCGKSYGNYASHVWSNTWDVTTKDGHAHGCTTNGCTAHSTIEKHTPGAAATETSEQRCTTCNYIIVPKLNHTHKTKKVSAVAPTCEKNGNVEYYTCTGCSKIFQDAAATKEITSLTDIVAPALGHKFTENWNMDATNHWHACAACGTKENVEKHIPGAAATETTDQICTVCAYVIQPAVSHTHTFSDHWFNDEFAHWKACTCGEVSEKVAHADADGDQACDSCHWAMSSTDPEDAVPVDPTEGTAPIDPTEGTETTPGSGDQTPDVNQNGAQDTTDDSGLSTVTIVVCVIAVLILAGGAVLAVMVVKRKKQ